MGFAILKSNQVIAVWNTGIYFRCIFITIESQIRIIIWNLDSLELISAVGALLISERPA